MMVSRKVFWGATWPLRTGIFAAGAVLLSTSEDSAGLEVVSHRHCPAPHPPLSPLHLAAERTTVPLSFSESDPPDLVSDNPEEGRGVGGCGRGGVESKLSPKWLETGTDAWCSLARRWSVQEGSVAAAELSVVSNSSRKRCDRIFVFCPQRGGPSVSLDFLLLTHSVARSSPYHPALQPAPLRRTGPALLEP